MDEPFFDVDPELSETRQALYAAWELIGYLDMGLEQIQSPHMPAKAKRELIAKLRAKVKNSLNPKAVS